MLNLIGYLDGDINTTASDIFDEMVLSHISSYWIAYLQLE